MHDFQRHCAAPCRNVSESTDKLGLMAHPGVHVQPKHHWGKDVPKRQSRAGTEKEVNAGHCTLAHWIPKPHILDCRG